MIDAIVFVVFSAVLITDTSPCSEVSPLTVTVIGEALLIVIPVVAELTEAEPEFAAVVVPENKVGGFTPE